MKRKLYDSKEKKKKKKKNISKRKNSVHLLYFKIAIFNFRFKMIS